MAEQINNSNIPTGQQTPPLQPQNNTPTGQNNMKVNQEAAQKPGANQSVPPQNNLPQQNIVPNQSNSNMSTGINQDTPADPNSVGMNSTSQPGQNIPPNQTNMTDNPIEPVGATPDIKENNRRYFVVIVFLAAVITALLIITIYTLINNDSDTDNAQETQTIKEDITGDEIESIEDPAPEATLTVSEILALVDAENVNVTITEDENYYYFMSNGIADHETGTFPNSGNPNTISEQDYDWKIPKTPVYQSSITDARIFGITLGGIPFEPATAETDPATGWNIEAFNDIRNLGLDFNNAHVQPTGAYHYHGIPTSVVEGDSVLEHSSLVGFAADGFPIYSEYGYSDPTDATSSIKILESSWQLRSGTRVDGPPGTYDGTYTQDFAYIAGSGDLDECNGRQTVTPEYPDGTYAYFLTNEFPYVGRCVHGVLEADSFATVNPGGGQLGAPGGAGGGPPAGGMPVR